MRRPYEIRSISGMRNPNSHVRSTLRNRKVYDKINSLLVNIMLLYPMLCCMLVATGFNSDQGLLVAAMAGTIWTVKVFTIYVIPIWVALFFLCAVVDSR